MLSDKTSLLCGVFNTECRDALAQMLEATMTLDTAGAGDHKKMITIQPDCPISFSQLSKLDSLVGAGDVLDMSLKQALGTGKISKADFASSKLNKVIITGCSNTPLMKKRCSISSNMFCQYVLDTDT